MGYTLVLIIHVASGVLAIACGFVALFAKKGSWIHRKAGTIFLLSMVVMAAGASFLGYNAPEQDLNDVIGGLLIIYLVTTAWMAIRRKDRQYGHFEIGAFVVAAVGTIVSIIITIKSVENGTAIFGGIPSYIFSSFMGLAAILDLRLILIKGLVGKQRVARHVWRMCLSMFIATGSFFLGQMHLFPQALQRIEIVSLPVLLVVILLIFWMIRVLFTDWYSKA